MNMDQQTLRRKRTTASPVAYHKQGKRTTHAQVPSGPSQGRPAQVHPSGVGRVHVIGDEVNSTLTDFWKEAEVGPQCGWW